MSGFLVGKDEEVTSEGWIKNTEHYCAFLCCTFFLGETFDFSAMYQNKVQHELCHAKLVHFANSEWQHSVTQR